jgi:hypothetical protein
MPELDLDYVLSEPRRRTWWQRVISAFRRWRREHKLRDFLDR